MLTKLYCKLSILLMTFKKDQRGVTAIEYGLIAACMATALVAIFYSTEQDTLIQELKDAFTGIAGQLTKVTPAASAG